MCSTPSMPSPQTQKQEEIATRKDQEFQNGLVTTYILCYQVDMTSGNDLVKAADNLREVLNK